MIITNGFTNKSGKNFDNIRHIALDSFSECGKLITESHTEEDLLFGCPSPEKDGVLLYQPSYSDKVAIRLYKDYADFAYSFHPDDKLISKLQEKQAYIHLTEFPTGVVTFKNHIVGQEIIFYKNFISIYSAIINSKEKYIPTELYLEILKILKELCEQRIVYNDVHSRNFLINDDNTIKLIDFEPFRISLENDYKYGYPIMIGNLKNMLEQINEKYSINFSEDFSKANTLENIEECVNNLHLSLKK